MKEDIFNETPVRFKAFMDLMINGKKLSIRDLANRWHMSKSGAQKVIEEWTKSGQKRVRLSKIKTKKLEKQSGHKSGQKVDTEKLDASVSVAHNVVLSQNECDKLVKEIGKDGARWVVNKLSAYKESSGKKYKSDYGAIRNWVLKEYWKESARNEYSKSNRDREAGSFIASISRFNRARRTDS